MQQIKDTPGVNYTEEEIKGIYVRPTNVCIFFPAAIQRKYESLRRHWKIEEEKEDCEEFLKLTSRKKKYRQRRQRVLFHA